MAVKLLLTATAAVAVAAYLYRRRRAADAPSPPLRNNSPEPAPAPAPTPAPPPPVPPSTAAAKPRNGHAAAAAAGPPAAEPSADATPAPIAPTSTSPPKTKRAGKRTAPTTPDTKPPAADQKENAAGGVSSIAAAIKRASTPPPPASPPKPKPPKEAVPPEDEPSAGDPFVTAVTARTMLTQPSGLLQEAQPEKEAPTPSKTTRSDKKKAKQKAKPISSWAEAFIEAMNTLEAGAPESAAAAQSQLNHALLSASKPGAPRAAMALTFRGLGYIFASTNQIGHAKVWYAKAADEARKRGGAALLLPCLRDLAVLMREMGDHAEAERVWLEAERALAASERAAPKGAAAAADAADAAARRAELELSRADTLRDQGRIADADALITAVVGRLTSYRGADDPVTLAAAFDLSRCKRAAALADADAAIAAAGASATMPLGAAAALADATAAATADAAAAAAAAAGDAAEAAGAVRAGKLPHVAAATVAEGALSGLLDAQAGVAPALDAQWQKGLRAMCADEAAVRWADHVVMIASLEQLHHHWAEAAHLFALAQPAYVDAHGDESLELAELMNSRGECYLELGCRGRARVCLDQAHAIVLETNGADDPSLASITANRSKLLSEEGDEAAAREGFDEALKVMRLCVDKLRRDADTNGLVMCQVLHARVLKLYSEHERLCGNDGAADAMAAEVKRLEMSYCFLA